MQRLGFKNIVMVIILLLLAGQTTAASEFSCAFMTSPVQTLDPPLVTDVTDHSQHMGTVTASGNQAASDCCPDCDCTAGSCSFIAIPIYQQLTLVTLASSVEVYSDKMLEQLPTSLFRPPITV